MIFFLFFLPALLRPDPAWVWEDIFSFFSASLATPRSWMRLRSSTRGGSVVISGFQLRWSTWSLRVLTCWLCPRDTSLAGCPRSFGAYTCRICKIVYIHLDYAVFTHAHTHTHTHTSDVCTTVRNSAHRARDRRAQGLGWTVRARSNGWCVSMSQECT